MNFRIKVKNDREAVEALTLLQKLTGKQIHAEDLTPEEFVRLHKVSDYSYMGINSRDCICGFLHSGDKEVLHYFTHLSEIISRLVSYKEYVVENVGKYTAKISRDGIEVGCQKISFEKFDEVAAMVAKFRSEN